MATAKTLCMALFLEFTVSIPHPTDGLQSCDLFKSGAGDARRLPRQPVRAADAAHPRHPAVSRVVVRAER
jgi:hypothetical protein